MINLIKLACESRFYLLRKILYYFIVIEKHSALIYIIMYVLSWSISYIVYYIIIKLASIKGEI